MRDIKFRAWDKNAEKMEIEGGYILLNGYGNAELFNDDIWQKQGIDGADFILMQYTGLRDKNSKEIYVGDIIKLTGNTIYDMSDELALQNIRIISYDENECKFNWDRSKSGTSFCKNNAEQGLFEIIGNIHENPELLEDKS